MASLTPLLPLLTSISAILCFLSSLSFFASGALQVYFHAASPHFYYTAWSFLLPTRYVDHFMDAAPVLITAKGASSLRMAAALSLTLPGLAEYQSAVGLLGYLAATVYLHVHERSFYSDTDAFLTLLLLLLKLGTLYAAPGSPPRAWSLWAVRTQASVPFLYNLVTLHIATLDPKPAPSAQLTLLSVLALAPVLTWVLGPLATIMGIARGGYFLMLAQNTLTTASGIDIVTAVSSPGTASALLYYVAQAAVSISFVSESALDSMSVVLTDLAEDAADFVASVNVFNSAASSSAERASQKQEKSKKANNYLDAPLLVALVYFGYVAQHLFTFIYQTSVHPCISVPDPTFKYTLLPSPFIDNTKIEVCPGSSLVNVIQTTYDVDHLNPTDHKVEPYRSPLTLSQISRMSTDPNYALQLGQMSAKATRADGRIDGEAVEVSLEYYRSYGSGSRVFFRADNGGKVNDFDNFRNSWEWFDDVVGWLKGLPSIHAIYTARGKAGDAMGDSRGTCFALNQGDFIRDLTLPSRDRENAATALDLAVRQLCDEESDVMVKAVVGDWLVHSDGKSERKFAAGGDWEALQRGVKYTMVAEDTQYNEVGVICVKHEGCEDGGFDAQMGALSEGGWRAIYENEKERTGDDGQGIVRQLFSLE
jgi:hypothetical protein